MGEQLGLGAEDAAAVAVEHADVGVADVRDHADLGAGDVGERFDLARGVHGDLEHGPAMARLKAQELERDADPVVEIALGDERRGPSAEDAPEQVLGGRLAAGAGHRDDARVAPLTPQGSDGAEGVERVVDDQDRPSRGRIEAGRDAGEDEAPGAS